MQKYIYKDIPSCSGVYYFIDSDGAVLYVGKAKKLRNRIRSYFLKELGRGPAIPQMVEKASGLKWIETESEIEAVILEAEQIKKLKPKYNIRLKDDKSFLVLKITKEDFPKIEFVRFKDIVMSDKSAWYFGPYPAGDMLRKSMRYLRKIFPFYDCSKTKWNTYKRKDRPCIYGDIFICPAPCVGEINKINYRKNINYLKNFLRGRKKEIVKSLEKEMATLSKQQKFEEASIIRNKLRYLDHLKNVALGIRDDFFSQEFELVKRIECYDISNFGDKYSVGSMIVFSEGKPDKAEYRKFKIKAGNAKLKVESEEDQLPASDLERLQQVLTRRFKRMDWPRPDLVIIDGGEQHLKVAKQILAENNLPILLISISKGPKRAKNDFHYSDLAVAKMFETDVKLKNVAIAARDEAHRFAIEYYRKLHRKEMFES